MAACGGRERVGGEEHAYNCASTKAWAEATGGPWQMLSPPLAHPLDYKELSWVEPEDEVLYA